MNKVVKTDYKPRWQYAQVVHKMIPSVYAVRADIAQMIVKAVVVGIVRNVEYKALTVVALFVMLVVKALLKAVTVKSALNAIRSLFSVNAA